MVVCPRPIVGAAAEEPERARTAPAPAPDHPGAGCDDDHVRVLVSTTAGWGHFGPLVALARAAAEAGHEVVVAAPASFASEVAGTGLRHRAFADPPPGQVERLFDQVPALSFEEAEAMVVAEVFGQLRPRAALPGLLDLVDEWRPDVMLREPLELGSLAAAVSLGVPHAVAAVGVTALTAHVSTLLAGPLADLDSLVGEASGTLAAAADSAPVLTAVPAALDAPGGSGSGTGPLFRFRDPTLTSTTGRLPSAWGDPALPLVYVTFGSVSARLDGYGRLYPAVLAAFADRPVRVLLTTGHAYDGGALPTVPGNVRVEPWWPQPDVMPYADAVVGHGGFGTTLTALAAGVPQVLLPLFSHDQHVNAAHVQAVGAGVTVDGGVAAVAALPDAVARLLADDSRARAARAVAREIATLAPVGEAVSALERVAAV